MLNHSDIMSTVDMIDHQHLDIRTITMGISLLDCADPNPEACARKVHDKICRQAEHLVATGCQIERELGIPIVNKRISVTPIALVASACETEDFVPFAKAMDSAAKTCGVDFIGGFSALVQKGVASGDRRLIAAIPQALAETELVCSSVNIGSTKSGINMDAVGLMGRVVRQTAELTKDNMCMGDAKLVVFCNAPEDNPFMAGAFHGPGEPDCEIHVGVSGPGAVRAALAKLPKDAPMDQVAELVKRTAFKITRLGQLVANLASEQLGVPAGIIDLSLAPTPAIGDSVANILEEMGLESCGCCGTTACLAMLNDAVKKGGVIICLAECPEGCSKEMDDPFEEWLGRYPDKDSVVAELKRKVNMGGLNCYKVRECQAHCRLILITALDQKRMAEVNVECYPKEQLNEVIRTVLAEYDHPKVLYMPQATLTLPLVKE